MTCKFCGKPVAQGKFKYCSTKCMRNWNAWSYLNKKMAKNKKGGK